MVAGVGRRGQRGERHPGAIGELGALEPELGPVHRAAPGALTAARRLGQAPVHRHVGQVQADQPLVGGQHRGAQRLEQPGGDPLVPPPAQRGGRTRPVGEAFVAAAEHQAGDQLVEHDAVIDAPAVTAQRMPVDAGRDQGEELLAQRIKDARWDGRHERSTAHGALAPSRAWPSCLPSTLSHAGRRQRPTGGSPYFLEQSTPPQTIGYSTLDSPVGLAAWLLDHDTDSYYKISRAFVDGEPVGNLTRDNVLDNITLYWLTGTGASAARWYWDWGRAQAAAQAAGQAPPPISAVV